MTEAVIINSSIIFKEIYSINMAQHICADITDFNITAAKTFIQT